MRIGRLFIGWRAMPSWEAREFGLSPSTGWRGFFIEWGTMAKGMGLLLLVEESRP